MIMAPTVKISATIDLLDNARCLKFTVVPQENYSESLISIFVFHTSSFEEGVRRGQAVVPDSGCCDCFYQDFVDNAQQLTFL